MPSRSLHCILKVVVLVQVVASCLDTLQPILLEDFSSVHDLRECLRASATVPAVAGDPVSHRDRLLVDAAVFEAIPFRAAIADGCTHVIALATRPPFRWAVSALLPDAKIRMHLAYLKYWNLNHRSLMVYP